MPTLPCSDQDLTLKESFEYRKVFDIDIDTKRDLKDKALHLNFSFETEWDI